MSDVFTLRAKKIMLVDDDVDFTLQNRIRFEECGASVVSASSLAEAKTLIAEEDPDVIILDLMMDERDAGMVLAHHFKKVKPSTPIIMVTGITRETGLLLDHDEKETRSWLKADLLLSKPIRFEQLAREIERVLCGR